MTGSDALSKIHDAIRQFAIAHTEAVPTTITLPGDLAHDLMKCGRDELPGLSEEFVRKGMKAYAEITIFGLSRRSTMM